MTPVDPHRAQFAAVARHEVPDRAILLLGAVMLYLLSSASANTPMFARDLPLLLFLRRGHRCWC